MSTCGLLAPCRRALARLFRIPASIRAFRLRRLRRRRRRMMNSRTYRSSSASSAVNAPLIPLPSSSSTAAAASLERGVASPVNAPVPSPETPAYEKMVARLRSSRTSVVVGEEEEEACRSFEACLMDVLTEEGKARELQPDVEELLRCMEKLSSPVFVDLVCRFYGDLCKDAFSSAGEEDGSAARSAATSAD